MRTPTGVPGARETDDDNFLTRASGQSRGKAGQIFGESVPVQIERARKETHIALIGRLLVREHFGVVTLARLNGLLFGQHVG